ncbi:VRR-NUC domain-containing protein [Rhodovarius lipocyclicus]|uniref:VRR-NUC domain-containing protein n=1 Tax=Rhodovarius lipocyclicus TaxID=268410 RepID=UPI00135AD171|nr:VRR-NUC domain-containing protein [Rhodovarius lipocyclicus]
MLVAHDMPLTDEIEMLGARPKRRAPEMDIQKGIVAFLRRALPHAVVAAIQNERGADGRTEGARLRYGALRKASGVVAGFPDLMVLLPQRVVFLEVKAPRGVVSESQELLHPRIRALGHPVHIVRSIEDAEAAMTAEGVRLSASTGRRRP